MKPKASSREPSHTSKFIWTACIVLLVVLLAIVLAKLVVITKFLHLQ
jgi:hypothetical protein